MTMNLSDRQALASRFRDLNLAGRLLLPNAWDAASARVFEQAGYLAIGTTSALRIMACLKDKMGRARTEVLIQLELHAALVPGRSTYRSRLISAP